VVYYINASIKEEYMRPYLKPPLRKLIIERDKECYLCGRPVAYVEGSDAPYDRQWRAFDAEGNTFHFEHVIPLVEGGLTDETNIRLACEECNLAKSRKERQNRAAGQLREASTIIKVKDGVYQELDHLRMGRQTFSDVIKELLDARLKVLELLSVLEGSLKYREWQREQLDKIQTGQRG